MTTISAPGFTPGRVRVNSPAPMVDDRDLTDEEVVAANIAEDLQIAQQDNAKRRRLFASLTR